MEKAKLTVFGKSTEVTIINSLQELPTCGGCHHLGFQGPLGLNMIVCRSVYPCPHKGDLERENYAMLPNKVGEMFRGYWAKEVQYTSNIFRILFVEGKPAWRVAFEVKGVAYVYFLKGNGKGTCRRLTRYEIENRKIFDTPSYEGAERMARNREAL